MANTYWDLFAAYSVIWLLVSFFVFRLMREQHKLRDELKYLRAEFRQEG